MSEQRKDKGVDPNKLKSKKGDHKSGQPIASHGMLAWLFILGIICILIFFKDAPDNGKIRVLTYAELVKIIDSSQSMEGSIIYNPQAPELKKIEGKYIPKLEEGASVQAEPVAFTIETSLTSEVQEKLLMAGLKMKEANLALQNLFLGILPFLLIALFIYYLLMRQIRSANRGASTFGRSRARMLNRDKNKTTFKDVAGVDEAVEEVRELAEYLKNPKKFQNLGGRIPRGILMVGSPGTGKTLLARAIAGEADADFFSISGSDFVEMFVGVGASRVRDMFEQARKHAPCLIFIDEIDAVGRSRGVGLGGGNDEREQTLNALLVEMDGFEGQEGIIIIAATNRPDVLDPALLRPGRFDRQVVVNLPDIKGREAILKVHAAKVKLAENVDLKIIARGTPGYSGAELANLLNEAALMAARANKSEIQMSDLEEARDKVRWGSERRSMALSEEEKRITAWHESGHAILNILLPHTDPLHKVTIIPRGQALGVTMSLPEEDVRNRTRNQMLSMITMAMGGRIAEKMVTSDISTGAAGDIKMATQLARNMVCHWGMSDRLGPVLYGEDNEYILLGRDMVRGKEYSNETANLIDKEVKRLIDESYANAEDLIHTNKDKVELIANALLENETLSGEEVEYLMKNGAMPPEATPPPLNEEKQLLEIEKKVEGADSDTTSSSDKS